MGLSIGDVTGIGSVFDFGSKIIDKFFPDKAQADAAKLELLRLQQAGEFKAEDQAFELAKAQIGVNQVEAQSTRLFVAGPRPFVMWTCGFALAYAAIIEPLARFVATVVYHYVGAFPVIDTTLTMQLLVGLLGLGGMRSYEKTKGVA